MSVRLVALFDPQTSLAELRPALAAIGIPAADVRISSEANVGPPNPAEPAREGPGLLDWLLGLPEEAATVCRRDAAAGRTVVVVKAGAAQAEDAVQCLLRFGPLEVDQTAPGVRVRRIPGSELEAGPDLAPELS